MLNPEKFKALEEAFISEVVSKRGGFEPDDNYCWWSVAAGFAMARNFSADDAYEFAMDLYRRDIVG